MSLKIFHVIFIIVAVALSILCAWWSLQNHLTPFAVASVGVGIALLVYGVWFLRKAKKIIT